MKYYVNENCIGCGMCNSLCSNVFELTNEGLAKAMETEVTDVDLADAEKAMTSCPVSAIEQI